jgi:signal transduction histidine kinase
LFSRARWRLTLWFAGAFTIIFVVLGSAVYFSAHKLAYDQVHSDLRSQSDAVLGTQDNSASNGPGGRFNLDTATILRVLSASGSFAVVTDLDGNFIYPVAPSQRPDLNLPSTDQLAADVSGEKTAYYATQTNDGDHLRVFVRQVYIPALNSYGYLDIGRSIEPELHSLRRLIVVLSGGGLIGLILAGLGGWWLAGRALKPIQVSMDAQRTFVADASHELRTPLSLIRANAEIMKRSPDRPPDPEFVDDIIGETDRLSYLVGQMLTLARADSTGARFERLPVDMSRLAEDMTRQMKLLASQKEIAMDAHTNGAAAVMGDEQRLGELLLILLDNSIKYTDRGGKVDVTVAQQNGHVQVAVADNGRGIPPEAIPHLFERFYRVDKARSREMGGTGLGLAIARWIADGHNGRLDIQSTPDKGTTVTVQLPSA